MAKNEPNKPDDEITMPANETTTDEKSQPEQPLEAGGETTSPEMTAKETETATPAHEGETPAHEGETLSGPDKVVSFDKINEIISDKKAAEKEQEALTPEDKAPEKKARRGGRPPKAEKADKEPKPEKVPKAEKSAKAPKAAKTKQAAGIGGAGGSVSTKATEKAQQETPPPAPEPEKPPEPREAPRSGEKEEIIYLNLSELHAFKDHPFQVKNDDEMRAMVESIKDKGVTQAAIVRPREDGGMKSYRATAARWQANSPDLQTCPVLSAT